MKAIIYIGSILFLLCISCKKTSFKSDGIETEVREDAFVITDSCMISSNRLYLCESGCKSVLKVKRNDGCLIDTLLLRAPCRFLREKDNVQSHSFDHINVTSVIFVVGDQKQSSPNYSAMQGIVFKEDSIIISKRKIDVDIVVDQWIDGKSFLDVAYYP